MSWRSGVKVLLDAEDDITVVGEAANGAEAVERARATRPDVVLMDIRMPELDGIKATSGIVRTRGLEQVRVLILTTYDTDAYVFEALQAGASGFLLKDAGPAELLHAIRVVAAGEALLAPRITRRLIGQFTAERIAGGEALGWRPQPCLPCPPPVPRRRRPRPRRPPAVRVSVTRPTPTTATAATTSRTTTGGCGTSRTAIC